MPLPKPINLFVSETRLRFCAIDCELVFYLWQLHPKKSKTVSETHAKWSQFGSVSETQGLAFYYPNNFYTHLNILIFISSIS